MWRWTGPRILRSIVARGVARGVQEIAISLGDDSGCRSGYSGTPWSSLPTSLPWKRFSMTLCRRWWTNWWTCSGSSMPRSPSRLSQCPKISCPSRPLRAAFAATEIAEHLVGVPVPPVHECAIPRAESQEEIVALVRDTTGHTWFQVRGPRGVYWWRSGSRHVQWALLRGPLPVQGGKQILGAAPGSHSSRSLQQSLPIDRQSVGVQFCHRGRVRTADRQRQVPAVLCRKPSIFRMCSFGTRFLTCTLWCNDWYDSPDSAENRLDVVDVPALLQRRRNSSSPAGQLRFSDSFFGRVFGARWCATTCAMVVIVAVIGSSWTRLLPSPFWCNDRYDGPDSTEFWRFRAVLGQGF